MSGLFLKKYLTNPGSVGAVCPSSRALARAMVAALDPKPGEPVIELGPGTGVFTRALLDAGMPEADIVPIEFEEAFVTHLRAQFPDMRVVHGNARYLAAIARDLGLGPVKQVLSGLPFRSMSRFNQMAIGSAIANLLEPGGVYVQFSYFAISPLPTLVVRRHGLKGEIADFVSGNLPPAFVWRYHKERQST